MKSRPFDVIAIAALVIFAVCVLSIGAAILASSLGLALTSAIALAVAIAPAAVAWYARRTLGARGPIFVAYATLVAVPFIFLGAGAALSEPIVHDFDCGLGIMGFAFAAPFGLGLFGTPLALGTWLLARKERPRFERALRPIAVISIALASALTAFAAVRRVQRPEAKDYIARLPVIVEIGKDAWAPAPLAELPVDKLFSGPPFTRADRADIPGGPPIFRACRDRGECRLWFGRTMNATPSLSWMDSDATLTVHRDANYDLYVIDGLGPRAAVYGDGRTRMPLYPRDVRGSLASPRDWIVATAIGAALAIALLARGRRREAEAAAIPWREGFVTASGTVVFADGMSVASPAALPEGTSVTAVREDASATFRSLPGVSRVIAGTLEDRAAEARAEGAGYAVRALLVIASTAAPLIACVVHRLVF